MYQNTLHKWINNENNENNFIENRFLNIIWKNKIPNSIEIINNEKPKNATIYRKIKVKSLNNVFFSGLIESSDEFIKLPISTDSNLLSLLKSNLQKCIRRQNTELAIQTCIHMWNISPIEVLRRLPIIMLEDVCLLDSFNVLIWMLGAYGKWKPTIKHLNWILGVVKVLSIHPIKMNINTYNLKINVQSSVEKAIADNDKNISNRSTVLCTLIIRHSYGGMNCDKNMILSVLWNLFLDKDLLTYMPIKPIKIKFYPLVRSDILIESVDFHCCKTLIKYLLRKHDDLNEQQIKNAIWENSSSTNSRELNKYVKPLTYGTFNKIYNDFKSFNKSYIEKSIKE